VGQLRPSEAAELAELSTRSNREAKVIENGGDLALEELIVAAALEFVRRPPDAPSGARDGARHDA